MKNEFQDLEALVPVVINSFTKNPRRSVSALYRKARKSPRYSLIGCYPILAVITHTAIRMGILLKRKNVTYAFNQSEELYTFPKRDKINLLNYLFHPPQVGLKQAKSTDNFNGNVKEDYLFIRANSMPQKLEINGSYYK